MNWRERMAMRKASEAPGVLDLPRAVTFFADRFAAAKTEEAVSLRGLVARIRDTMAPYKGQLPWLKLASFGERRGNGGSLRNDANVVEITGVEADYDGEMITLDRARRILGDANVAALLYTSPSHRPDAPRWRILCPTSMSLPPDQRVGLVARLNGLFAGALAGESFTLSQSYYYGSIPGAEHEVVLVEGKAIDLCDHLDEQAVGRPAKPAPSIAAPMQPTLTNFEDGSRLGREALDQRCAEIRNAADGDKHRAVNEAAFAVGGLVAQGHLVEGTALAELLAALGAILPRCKDPRKAERDLRKAFSDGLGRPQAVAPPEAEPPLAPAVLSIEAGILALVAARKAERAARETAALAVAPDLMDVPGALGMFVAHCEATAVSPQPFLALAAGICMIGALAGRKYRTTTDLRTNVYAIGVADSGAGKDHARKQIAKCLRAAGLSCYLGGSDIASGAGLRTALGRHPSMLFQIDEFGDWLADVLGEKASTHRKQIASMLKELYSSAAGPWQGTEYADQSAKGKPREDIQQPNACLYGTTTPGQFWGAVAGANMHDGLMARMLLFVSPCSYPDEREPGLAAPPDALTTALQAIAAGQEGGGNLAAAMLSNADADPLTVPETGAARDMRLAMRKEQLVRQRKAEGTYVTAIAGRLAENAMKLALIRAVSRDPGEPVIQADDVQWGQALATHCIETLLREAGQRVADTDYERRVLRAVEYVRRHGPISAREMFAKGWRLPERERDEILRSLVDSGLVVAIAANPGRAGGRPTVRYAVPGAGGTETQSAAREPDAYQPETGQ